MYQVKDAKLYRVKLEEEIPLKEVEKDLEVQQAELAMHIGLRDSEIGTVASIEQKIADLELIISEYNAAVQAAQ